MKNDIKKYLTLGAVLAGSALMVSCDGDDVTVVEGADATDVQPTIITTDAPTDLSNVVVQSFNVINAEGNDNPVFDPNFQTFANDNTNLLGFGTDLEFDPAIISANTITLNNIQAAGSTPSLPTQDDIDAAAPQAAGTAPPQADVYAENPILTVVETVDNTIVTGGDNVGDAVVAHNNNVEAIAFIDELINGRGASAGLAVSEDGTNIVVDGLATTATIADADILNAYTALSFTGGTTLDGSTVDPDETDFVGLQSIVDSTDSGFVSLNLFDGAVQALTNANAYREALVAANAELVTYINNNIVTDLGPEGADILLVDNASIIFTITNAFANDEDFIFQSNVNETYDISGAALDTNATFFGIGQIRLVPDTTVTSEEFNGVTELEQDN